MYNCIGCENLNYQKPAMVVDNDGRIRLEGGFSCAVYNPWNIIMPENRSFREFFIKDCDDFKRVDE